MQIEVWTGQTKAKADTVLLPIILGDEGEDRVFLLLQSEGKTSGVENLREECVSVLTHAVLEGEGGGYERLESALKELNGLLKGFLLSGAIRDVHAVVGLLEDDGSLHISHVGRAEAYVVRDGSAIQVTEYYGGKTPTAFVHIVSGPVQEKDHFIISTQRLLRSMTPSQLSQTIHQHGPNALEQIVKTLADDKEVACLIHVSILQGPAQEEIPVRRSARSRTARPSMGSMVGGALQNVDWSRLFGAVRSRTKKAGTSHIRTSMSRLFSRGKEFMADLYHPERKRRAHLFLLAGVAGLFVLVWVLVQVSLLSQKSQTKGELKALVDHINKDLSAAENRELAGDSDGSNALLKKAEDDAKKVMSNESGLFRSEALDLLDRITSKREEINRIYRVVAPRIMASLSGKKGDVLAQGFIGTPSGEFIVYEHQNGLYRVSLNTVDEIDHLGSKEMVLDGADFPRFQSTVFLTSDNSIVEVANGQATTMKTEDPSGWVTAVDIETYLRYLYVLSPEKKQIYKYEHLSGKFGPPAEYNVNGDLTGAKDMTIQGPIYILRDTSASGGGENGRDVIKLLRGEKQTFNIRNLPPGALVGVEKIFKSSTKGNLYFLDPKAKRIVVTTDDGDLGDSLYLRQYVLDSDEVGTLKDLYVDPDDSRLFILDEKKVYTIDLQAK